MPARPFLARRCLGEKARAQTHRRREVLDRHLGQRGGVSGTKGGSGSEVQLQEPWPSLRVNGGQLDSQGLKGRSEGAHKGIESAQLPQAVAEPAGEGLGIRIPQPQLVLDRGDGLVAELCQPGEHAAQDLTRRELARAAVRPAWGGEADLPARPPSQLVKGGWFRANEEVAGA